VASRKVKKEVLSLEQSASEELAPEIAQETTAEAVSEISQEISPAQLCTQVAALIFASGKPIGAAAICAATGKSISEVQTAVDELQERYRDDFDGFSLTEVNGGWQFRTAAAQADLIQKLLPQRERRLSRAAAETLAIIAYRQPIQRAEIEAMRGVDALPTIKTLLDAKLISPVGRDESVGHPTLYGTTDLFLEKFGLRDLSELPSRREIEQIVSEPGESEVAQRELLAANE